MLTTLGVAVVIAGATGAALAAIPDSSGAIHGCYLTKAANKKGGTPLNIVNSDKTSCLKTQSAVSWIPGPHVLDGAVNDNGSTASFYLGGSGMQVSEISTGVTQLSIPSATSQPVVTVTAVAADSTEHCALGNSINTTTYDIDCFDQGQPWPVTYHVIVVLP